MKTPWYNHDTKKHDYLSEMPKTAAGLEPYITDWPGAREMFRLYIEHYKYTPEDAYLKVLHRCVGDIEKSDKIQPKATK